VNAEELDRTYVLLAQAMTRVPRERRELFLARLALLLIAAAEDSSVADRAIVDAEADLDAQPLGAG
jgi:hypothetical protein